jgi:hypothetical protein
MRVTSKQWSNRFGYIDTDLYTVARSSTCWNEIDITVASQWSSINRGYYPCE